MHTSLPWLNKEPKRCPRLRHYVEQQLIDDLNHYGIEPDDLGIDWSRSCGEGHTTAYLDGVLENDSEVYVVNREGIPIAGGWVSFLHLEKDDPLFVWWDSLSVYRGDETRTLSSPDQQIPRRVWLRMPESIRERCIARGYDPETGRWREQDN